MGNAQSTDALPEPAEASTTVCLYRYKPSAGAGSGGSWVLVGEEARWNVYDENEDRKSKSALWVLEVEAGGETVEAEVDDSFTYDLPNRRVTFFARSFSDADEKSAGARGSDPSIFSLSFPGAASVDAFLASFNAAARDNLAARAGAAGEDAEALAGYFGSGAVEPAASRAAWTAQAAEEDVPAIGEFSPARDRAVALRSEGAIRSLLMGAGERSFIVREGQVDVLANEVGGVQDTSLSFSLKLPGGGGGSGVPRGSASPATPQRATRSSARAAAASGSPSLASAMGSPVASTPPQAGERLNVAPGSRTLLARGERALHLITPSRLGRLTHADVETGRVVNDFSFVREGVEDYGVADICNETKTAQLEDRSTFLGLSSKSLLRWDTRLKGGLAQEMTSPAVECLGGKSYKLSESSGFTCMATSADGYVAVGARDGRVRLYSERTLTQARTSIPGLGASITGIDVTFDGQWVVATTARYLMVLLTTYRDPDTGNTRCGFTSRLGADAPAPRVLRLRPEDVARTGGAALEKAHFSWVTDAGRPERWIVASVGNYSVLWNFRSVKTASPEALSLGGLTTVTQYNLIAKQDAVVDAKFMHDRFARVSGRGDSAMVVATKSKVYSLEED